MLRASRRCEVQANPDIVEAAEVIAKNVLGQRYMGIHLRRGDFKTACAKFSNVCFQSLSYLAGCIADRIISLGK